MTAYSVKFEPGSTNMRTLAGEKLVGSWLWDPGGIDALECNWVPIEWTLLRFGVKLAGLCILGTLTQWPLWLRQLWHCNKRKLPNLPVAVSVCRCGCKKNNWAILLLVIVNLLFIQRGRSRDRPWKLGHLSVRGDGHGIYFSRDFPPKLGTVRENWDISYHGVPTIFVVLEDTSYPSDTVTHTVTKHCISFQLCWLTKHFTVSSRHEQRAHEQWKQYDDR